MALLTLHQAKEHLRITTDEADSDIYLKLQQAEALILGRCNSTAWWRAITATWTAATVPFPVQAAILVVVTHLHERRGDDMATDEALWAAVDRLISLTKDPVLT